MICHPKRLDGVPPRAPPLTRFQPNIPHTASTNYQLIVKYLDWLAATLGQGPTILSIFWWGLCWCPPNRETNSGTAKPDGACLEWAYRKWRHHELGAPLPYPGREGARPLEGRAAAAHFGCCVFMWLCLWAHLATLSYLTCKKVKTDRGLGLQNWCLFPSIMEKVSQKPMHIVGCPTLSGFEDDGQLLIFMYGCCFGVVWMGKESWFLSIFT